MIIPAPVAFGVFIAAVIVSRILQERALRRLSTEEKGRLVEAFSAYRMFALLPLAAIAGLYFAMSQLDALTTATMLAIYVPLALGFAVVMQVLVYRKLRKLSVDPAYLRVYSGCRLLMLVAFVVLMLGV
ncbi:MAG: hypothetical protein IAG13_22695 [Deltaproteobacteria bacterium]|nr:hypothetical protein [Nannocystaceae bacterium]